MCLEQQLNRRKTQSILYFLIYLFYFIFIFKLKKNKKPQQTHIKKTSPPPKQLTWICSLDYLYQHLCGGSV